MDRIKELLENDSSYQYVPNNSDSPHGKAFLRLFGKGKAQSRERKIYEEAAKFYYRQGLEDGADNMNHPHNMNVSEENYDFLMKLLVLMGVSFQYVNLPYYNGCFTEKDLPKNYHGGLNAVFDGENHIPDSIMNHLKLIVSHLHNRLRTVPGPIMPEEVDKIIKLYNN